MKKLIIVFLMFVIVVSSVSAQDLIMKSGFEEGEPIPGTVQLLLAPGQSISVSQGQTSSILYRGTIRNGLALQFNLGIMVFQVVPIQAGTPFLTNVLSNQRLVFRPSGYVVSVTNQCPLPQNPCIEFLQEGMVGMASNTDQYFELIADVGSTAGFTGSYRVQIGQVGGDSVPSTQFAFSGFFSSPSVLIVQ